MWVGLEVIWDSKIPAIPTRLRVGSPSSCCFLGAVLYCKTSTPQTLFFVETKNNIIGQTLNPHNQNLSCGGSSGGEGALLALRGSTLGVGTDIGGSVRIPAAFNGVFGIKPTPGRLSSRDIAETNPGQTTYRATLGFLGTWLDGLELLLKAVLSTQPWSRSRRCSNAIPSGCYRLLH